MMNASQIHTNDTLATSRKPAAKSALKKITPPDCKNLRILILYISILFTLSGCEKLDIESSSPSDITSSTKAVVTQESLLGDWHILSAVVPVGTSPLTADIAWEGTMMEITEDSVRFHRHDLVYPSAYPGETTDHTLASYPATYSPDGHITINGCPLVLFPQEDGTIIMNGGDVEITISRSPSLL